MIVVSGRAASQSRRWDSVLNRRLLVQIHCSVLGDGGEDSRVIALIAISYVDVVDSDGCRSLLRKKRCCK